MQESIVSYQGHWWHFFYKPSYGLCFRKKDGMRFGEFEILFKEAEEDFRVLSLGSFIHIVCQDHAGAILYLVYDGKEWEKLTLLTSKEGKPAPKHFSLLAVGSRLNLYYVIEYKEKSMLVHQFLNAPNTEPKVVDYITASSCPYQVCSHFSGDLTVCYQNAQGICGMRTFDWSQKSYQPFRRLPIPVTSVPAMLTDEDDTCHFAAVTEIEGVHNLICFRCESDGSFSEPSTVCLECGESPAAVLFRQDGRLRLEWLENGSVMTSYLAEETEKWKKPVKYMRSAATPVVLYRICEEGKITACYGFSDNGSVNLYGAGNLIAEPPKAPALPKYRPRGSEAAEFAGKFGYHPHAPESSPEQDFITAEECRRRKEEFLKEQAEIKQLLTKQNDIILELLRRVGRLEEESEQCLCQTDSSSPAENEEDIDAVLWKAEKESGKQPETQPTESTTKVVVTAK